MISDPQLSTPEPPQTEPTVLDLFKSVTRDWRSFFDFLGSVIGSERETAMQRAADEQARQAAEAVALVEAPQPEAAERSAVSSLVFPWRSSLSIFLALFAQLMLEPPGRRSELGLAFYQRVRRGYYQLAQAEPHRWVVIDAGRPPEQVQEDLRRVILERLKDSS